MLVFNRAICLAPASTTLGWQWPTENTANNSRTVSLHSQLPDRGARCFWCLDICCHRQHTCIDHLHSLFGAGDRFLHRCTQTVYHCNENSTITTVLLECTQEEASLALGLAAYGVPLCRVNRSFAVSFDSRRIFLLGGISSASPLVRVVIALASGSTEVREFELRRTAKLAALQRTATERLFPFVVPFIFVRDFIFRKFVTMALRLKSLRSALSSILTHTYRHTRRKLHTHTISMYR